MQSVQQESVGGNAMMQWHSGDFPLPFSLKYPLLRPFSSLPLSLQAYETLWACADVQRLGLLDDPGRDPAAADPLCVTSEATVVAKLNCTLTRARLSEVGSCNQHAESAKL